MNKLFVRWEVFGKTGAWRGMVDGVSRYEAWPSLPNCLHWNLYHVGKYRTHPLKMGIMWDTAVATVEKHLADCPPVDQPIRGACVDHAAIRNFRILCDAERAAHDKRVSELIERNNIQLEQTRAAEQRVRELTIEKEALHQTIRTLQDSLSYFNEPSVTVTGDSIKPITDSNLRELRAWPSPEWYSDHFGKTFADCRLSEEASAKFEREAERNAKFTPESSPAQRAAFIAACRLSKEMSAKFEQDVKPLISWSGGNDYSIGKVSGQDRFFISRNGRWWTASDAEYSLTDPKRIVGEWLYMCDAQRAVETIYGLKAA